MLTLNQLLKFEEKTEDGTTHRLSIKTSNFGDKNTDYEISGLMPVKIDIKAKMDIHGIKFNLMDLLHKYAKEKHGSEIYGYSCGIIKDNYKREFRIKLPKYINFDNDPDFVQVDGYYMNFNASYTYHRYTKKYLSDCEKRKKKNKEYSAKQNKNKKEK